MLQSRHGRNLTPYFPDVVDLLRAQMPVGVVLDGELVVWSVEGGRTSFAALQRRITAGRGLAQQAAARPAHLVVFDLLADVDGQELLDWPLSERRARLQRLLAGGSAQLPICPQTLDVNEARRWLEDWAEVGVEGVLVKDLSSRYRLGQPGWLKVKTRTTTEAVIGGVTGSIAAPGVLLLGRYDDAGRLRYIAETHRLPDQQRQELAGLLQPAPESAGHPWPAPLPAAWSAQLDDRRPLPYVRVQPSVVAEVEVDVAYDAEYGRWRHRVRFVRARTDLAVSDVPSQAAGF